MSPRRLTLLFIALVTACASPPAALREMTWRSADGSRLFGRVIGSGADTVVVLHGGPGLHSGYLVGPLQPLAAGRTLILFDQRGRGHSDPAPDDAGPTVDDDVRDLEAVRSQLKLSRFAILAHHYGALVAIDYALAHPGRVSRLVLVGPMVPRARYRYDLAFRSPDTIAIERYRTALQTDLPRRDPVGFCRENWGFFLGSERETDPAVVRAIAPGLCDSSAFAKTRVDDVNAKVTTALADWDYRARAARLTIPVLVISGDRDPVLLHAARTWALRPPQGRLVTLRSAGQFPWVGVERTFAAATGAFLDGRWPAGAERPDPRQAASPDDSATVAAAPAAPGTHVVGSR